MKLGEVTVRTLKDFHELHEAWGFTYPKKNELLTVVDVKNYDGLALIPTMMLKFKGYDDLPWMCLFDSDWSDNFEVIIDLSLTL